MACLGAKGGRLEPFTYMKQVPASAWSRLVIAGAVVFILALVGSAIVVPALRPLHALQACIYVAVIFAARRQSAWGFGAGVTMAVAWNSLQLFITHLMLTGAKLIWALLQAGRAERIDTMMVFVAGLGHFAIMVGGVMAVIRLGSTKKLWLQFAGGGVLVLAYFASIVYVALPRS